jgi:RHS repeat-associated protein
MMRRIIIVLVTMLVLPTAAGAQGTEQVFYYDTDAIGSVRAVTDATGTVSYYDFTPFGEPWSVPSTPGTRQFAGKERDANSGLDYFGARYYASQTGRFTTVDPLTNIDAALTDPQRWNRYAYARNNPLVFIDPDGKELYRVITPWERELMRMAGAIRDRVASALGADSAGPPHPLAVFSQNVVDSLLATVLPRDDREYGDAANAAILGMAVPLEGGPVGAVARLKSVNLPAWRTVAIDMEEVISGHTSSGLRAAQSGMKSLFPDAMSSQAIESAVRNAYRYGKKIATQENRVRIRGPWDGGTIELWLNTTTKTIETAYPVR